MGILGYNTRIMELRRAGHEIITVMEDVQQEGEKLELWVIRRVFADEIAQSFDEAKVCRVLADNGLLKYNHKNRGYQHQRKGNGWFHVLATNIELDD